MQQTAQHLSEIIQAVFPLLRQISDPEASIKPAPDKWSKKEIIGHLIDSACNNQQKFVRTLHAESGHLDFVGYDQDQWVAAQQYQQADWQFVIALWSTYNMHLAHVIAHIPPEKLDNTLTIDGAGPFKLGFIVPDYIEHLKHHLIAVLPEAGFSSTFTNVYNA